MVDLYLMLGSLPKYLFSPLLGVVDLYLMLGSLLGICLVHYSVWLTCTLCKEVYYKSTTPSSGLNKYMVNFLA